MKILAVLFSVSILVLLGHEAVVLHRLTTCRQEAWRSSLTLHTRALLTRHDNSERDVLASCRILVLRSGRMVLWKRLGSGKHVVDLRLKDKL